MELSGLTVFRDRLAMVSPWMKYGSLLSYIRAHPTANRYSLVSFQHLRGFCYAGIIKFPSVSSDC
jgi:hypothetical protein